MIKIAPLRAALSCLPLIALACPAAAEPHRYPVIATSGNVAAATAAATLPAAQGLITFISGFEITAGGATAGSCVTATVTGLAGGSLSYAYCAPTGATAAAAPLVVPFRPPLPASSVNTAIAVTLPSLGAGNTTTSVSAHGFQQ